MIARDENEPSEPIRSRCSHAQSRFWYEEQLSPGDSALGVTARWQINGELTHAILEQTWRRIIARHPALRTEFRTADGEPLSSLEGHVSFSVPIVDLRAMPHSQAGHEADRLARVHAGAPFDLTRAPLIRVTHVLLSNAESILLVAAHRIICDHASMHVLRREFGQIAAALDTGVVPLLTDFDGHARGARSAGSFQPAEPPGFDCEYAQVESLLRGHTPFELLPDRARPRRLPTASAVESKALKRPSTDALAQLAQASDCTIFSAWLSVIFALLSRFSGETDIVIGVDVAARAASERERVGAFTNTIAVRGDLASGSNFHTLLERTHGMASSALETWRLPLARLVDIVGSLPDPSRNALFSVNVRIEHETSTKERYGAFEVVDMAPLSTGMLGDIELRIIAGALGWRLDCEYNTALFDASTVVRLLDSFDMLLAGIAADPATPIAGIEILSRADRDELGIIAPQTRAHYPAGTTLPQLIAEQTARTPDATAIVCGSRRLTYAQLDNTAERLAAEIVCRISMPGARVGIVLDRSPDMVVAMLGVLRAGSTYVPIDPNYPAERIAYIVADGALAAVITHGTFANRSELANTPKILIESIAEMQAQIDGTNRPAIVTSADDIAYMIYTSGSTGRPKAVEIPHRALVNFLWAMRERPGLAASDTLVAVTTISFDIAGLELFLPLITGAKLVIARESECVDGKALIDLFDQVGATFVQATPATWQLLIEAGWSGDSRLVMLCGGEALSRPLAQALLDRGAVLWNMYGPTETTIWSSAGQVVRGSGPVLIGPPIANTQFYVVDSNGRRVPPGVAGELWIGGDGVARGYFKRPDLTGERFVDDTFGLRPAAKVYRTGDIVRTRAGGHIEFLGRTDHQVKIRGFRIELDEIAAVLLAQTGVADAVVTADPDQTGQPAIRAYVVANANAGSDTIRWALILRAQLGGFLPKYMLPATIDILEALPRLPNGKVNRAALSLPRDASTSSTSVGDAPISATEIAVAKIVSELLDRRHIGRHADLFALGLHSLLVMRLITRFRQAMNVELSVRTVFEDPTIAAVALHIDRVTSTAPPSPAQTAAAPIVTYHANGDEPAFVYFHNDDVADGIHCRPLAAAIGPATPLVAIAPYGHAGLPVLTTIEAMALDALSRIDARKIRGPYRLGGFCSGGFVALELARFLRARGECVESVIIINAHAPLPHAIMGIDALIRRIGLEVRINSYVREKVCLNIARVTLCINRGPAAMFRFIADRLRTMISLSERQRQHADANPYLPKQRAGTSQTEAGLARIVADLTYHPQPYDGETTLIWSYDEEPLMGDPLEGDPTMGWAAISNRLRVVPVNGGHYSPIRENIGELGAIITHNFASTAARLPADCDVLTSLSNDQEGQ